MTREDDALTGRLIGRFAPEGSGGGPDCPGDNALAAFLEGHLQGRARTDLERHLAECTACGAVVAEALALRGAGAESAPAEGARTSPRRPSRVILALAAVLVAMLGAAWWAFGRGEAGSNPEADLTLTASAAALRTARPDLFAGFEVLSAAEFSATAPTRLRGGLTVVRPAETLLERRPSVEWTAAPGAVGYEVSVSVDGGAVVWHRMQSLLTSAAPPEDAPDLVPGTKYVARVESRGPLGRTEATRRFALATDKDRDLLAEALREIDRRAPPSQRAVLRAQFAVRRGFLLEAERHLGEALAAHPGDAAARETLRYVRRRLGAPDP
jgi:anti-sigma factor RsiW